MNITFSANNNQEIRVLPVVPDDTPVSQAQNNEEFETLNGGTLKLIGDMGLRSLSISSVFLNRKYNFAKKGSSSNGWLYVDFFVKWRKKRVPLRVIMTTDSGKEVLNMPCTVDNFTYAEARNGNINYTLEVSEYRFV